MASWQTLFAGCRPRRRPTGHTKDAGANGAQLTAAPHAAIPIRRRHGAILLSAPQSLQRMGNGIRQQHGGMDAETPINSEAAGPVGRAFHQARRKGFDVTRTLNAALHYISDNIPVFPVSRVDKHPLCPNGFHDATINENQIREWWQTWPNAMIGIPTGPRSGIWVLDVDIDVKKNIDGHETMARLGIEYGPLPLTLCSITPRGGKHYLFRWNGTNIRNSVEEIG